MGVPCNGDSCNAAFPSWCQIEPGCTPVPMASEDHEDMEWDPTSIYDYCNPTDNGTAVYTGIDVQACTINVRDEEPIDRVPNTDDDAAAVDRVLETGSNSNEMVVLAEMWAPLSSIATIQFRVAFPILVEFSIIELTPSSVTEVLEAVRATLVREGISDPQVVGQASPDHPNRLAITVQSEHWPRTAAVLSGEGQHVPYQGLSFSVILPPGMYSIPPVAQPTPPPPTTGRPTTGEPTPHPTNVGANENDGAVIVREHSSIADVLAIAVGTLVLVIGITVYGVRARRRTEVNDDTTEKSSVAPTDTDTLSHATLKGFRYRLGTVGSITSSKFEQRSASEGLEDGGASRLNRSVTISSGSTLAISRLSTPRGSATVARKRSRIQIDMNGAAKGVASATEGVMFNPSPLKQQSSTSTENRKESDRKHSMEWDPSMD